MLKFAFQVCVLFNKLGVFGRKKNAVLDTRIKKILKFAACGRFCFLVKFFVLSKY